MTDADGTPSLYEWIGAGITLHDLHGHVDDAWNITGPSPSCRECTAAGAPPPASLTKINILARA